MVKRNNIFPKIGKLSEFIMLFTLFLLPFYFIKFKYSWISLNLIEILTAALFLFWIFNKEKKYPILNTQYSIPVGLILTGVILSIVANENFYVGLGILKGWFILPIVFALIFYDSLEKNEKFLGWSLQALFYGGVLVSIEGIYYWLSGLLTYDGRLRIFYDSPNQLAMYLAPVFFIGIKLGFEKLRGLCSRQGKAELWKAGLVIMGTFLVALSLYLTKSYGAWLAIAVTLAAVFWLVYREKLRLKYLFVTAVFFVILISAAGLGKFESIKNLGDRSSLASREMIWRSSVLMIRDNPLFGIGPGNFQNKYLEYQKYFPPYLEWAVPQPHNLFLAWWLEAGLVGLIGFILLLIQFFHDNKKARKNNPEISLICLAVILYFLIHGLIDTTYWRNDIAVIFWAIIAANLCLAKN